MIILRTVFILTFLLFCLGSKCKPDQLEKVVRTRAASRGIPAESVRSVECKEHPPCENWQVFRCTFSHGYDSQLAYCFTGSDWQGGGACFDGDYAIRSQHCPETR